MERMTKIGMYGVALIMLAACGKGIPGYDATGTFEATEVIVSAEAAGKLLRLEVEEGTRLKAGEEIGLVDTVQLYLKKLQLEASMKSVESQRPDLAKQIAATKQQIATAEREKKRVENLLAAGAANQKQLDDWDAQVKLLERQLVAQESSLQNCSVLNKLTLLKFEIHMEELKKKYTPYTESERMSYIREYLSTSETKYQFAKRTGICRRLLILWLEKYHINDKVMNTEQPSLSKASDESLNELEKELAALRAENRKLQRALQEESLRHEACEELINLAESTYHIKVRKNSDAK